MPESSYTDLAVVGAGSCGLAAAWYARAAGLQVQLFEAQAEAGGRVGTTEESINGERLVIEHGPAGWLGENPLLTELCNDLNLQMIESSAADSHRYLIHDNQLVPFPQSAAKMAATKLLRGREKLRAASERWADFAPEGKEETAKEFFERRFGPGFAKTFVAPIVRGLFAGDYETLSLSAAFPKLVDVEYKYGSITKALKKNPGFFGQKLRSFPRGLTELTQAISTQLGNSFLPSRSIDSVVREQGWWFLFSNGAQVGVARQVAVCLPAAQTAMVLREYLPNGADSLARFQGSDLASVSLLFKDDQIEDPCAGFGILAPAGHPSPVLNVQFAHSIFPEHVPEGYLLLRCLMGGEASPDVLSRTDSDLVQILSEDLNNWLQVDRPPKGHWVTRVPGGVPRYGLGHSQSLHEIFKGLEPNRGLHLGGDAFFGIGVTPALERGRQIAADAANSSG
jgi:oxygen-dependent protoporphyrinogen oxidase